MFKGAHPLEIWQGLAKSMNPLYFRQACEPFSNYGYVLVKIWTLSESYAKLRPPPCLFGTAVSKKCEPFASLHHKSEPWRGSGSDLHERANPLWIFANDMNRFQVMGTICIKVWTLCGYSPRLRTLLTFWQYHIQKCRPFANLLQKHGPLRSSAYDLQYASQVKVVLKAHNWNNALVRTGQAIL